MCIKRPQLSIGRLYRRFKRCGLSDKSRWANDVDLRTFGPASYNPSCYGGTNERNHTE
jgi:hypothetical protein